MTEVLVARARVGDDRAFRELVEPYRRELYLHCYRLLGSLTDAEDVLQEALLAAWRGLADFEERASLRTWLYRIATNRCLNAIRDGARRIPPSPVPPFQPPEPTRRSEVTWLQPYPDALLDQVPDQAPGPEACYALRESVELAFVVGLQRLPPRQAATLVLRDVLGYSAAEVAGMLDTSETAVKGALQRARATLDRSRPTRDRVAAGSFREQELSRRFAAAFVARDIDGLLGLLTDDAWLAMPPAPHEYHGPAAVASFLRVSGAWRGRRRLLLVPTRANRQPALRNPRLLRQVLDSLTAKLDGTPAAPSVTSRRRKIRHAALEYAVELELLDNNPMPALKWTPPKTTHAVDRRRVANPIQARTLLHAVDQQRGGRRLVAFFGCLYYAALRPEEAISLAKHNLSLPTRGWGELHVERAEPYAGKEWTDSGRNRDQRPLKQRARGEVRIVPCPPALTELLHAHIAEFGVQPDGRLFVGERNGGELPTMTIGRMWRRARQAAFMPEVAASPLARTPYDLRHAAVSTWLNGGVPATTVAEWAGHSVEILLRIYAKCLDGGDTLVRRRIQAALGYADNANDEFNK